MKKYLLFIPLLIISCQKETKTEISVENDSMEIIEDSSVFGEKLPNQDSVINNLPQTKEVLKTGVMRNIEGNKIVRTADAFMLPFTIGEEFTEEQQEFILKIKNYDQPKIKAQIESNEKDFNIRFNQIRLADGSLDGPFGKNIEYETPEDGEIWLVIGKNNMASGKSTGKFTVSIE